jgi:soluble lytic murein transglycosylase-like protein
MLPKGVTMKKILVAALVALPVLLAACTPAEIAWWNDPSVPQSLKDEVRKQMTKPATAKDCYEAIDIAWPGDKAWARRIVWRESNNTPTARNSSGASGCFQLMLPLHNRLFTAAGYSPSQWADPIVNVKVAWTLYQAAGTSPWVLTNY